MEGWDDYFESPWNYADVAYYSLSAVSVILHLMLEIRHWWCMLIMCIIVVLISIKTFFYFRIFSKFAPIIYLMKEVIYDLRIFSFIFGILILICSLMFSVIGVGL